TRQAERPRSSGQPARAACDTSTVGGKVDRYQAAFVPRGVNSQETASAGQIFPTASGVQTSTKCAPIMARTRRNATAVPGDTSFLLSPRRARGALRECPPADLPPAARGRPAFPALPSPIRPQAPSPAPQQPLLPGAPPSV